MDWDSQRRSTRHAVTTECVVRRRRDQAVLARECIDLSWHGVFAVTTDPQTIDQCLGEDVVLSIHVPGSHLHVRGEGRVTRISRGRRQGDRAAGVGIAIRKMDGISRMLLTKIVADRPPPTPTRGVRRDYAKTIARIAESE